MRKTFLCQANGLVSAFLISAACCVSLPGQAQSPFPPPMAARPPQLPAPPAAAPGAPLKTGPIQIEASPSQDSPSPLTTLVTSWEGIPTDFMWEPPDPHGAAGPNGVIQTVNVRLAYWNKAGAAIWGPVPLGGFFASVGNNSFSFDPRAVYDPGSGRFYVLLLEQDSVNEKSYLNLAVSKSSNPASSGPADWFLYRIDNTRTNNGIGYWGDYPGLGFDGQAVYITVNLYTFTNLNGDAQITILDKASLTTGTANPVFVFTSGVPGGGFTLQPCTVTGSNSPVNVAYFGETLFSATTVRVWALSDPLGAGTLASTIVTVPDNGGLPPFSGAPQPGTSITIDTLDGRAQGNAFWFDDAIWFCHTAGGATGKSLVYYYKINLNNYPSGVPALAEEGFIDGGPGEWTYQPSIGANALGDVGIVYCQSSFTRNPSIFATTRKASAVAFDTPTLIKASPGFYFGSRWGDFASVSADPVDQTFWVTHEWARSTQPRNWGTWWANVSPTLAPLLIVATNYLTGGNGNGVVDPNECNQLFLVVSNIGSLGATNIQTTLTTTNEHVIVTGRLSPYPDLPPGAGSTNLVPFQFSTSPSFVCGTPVNFALTIKSDQATVTNFFTVLSGLPGTPVRYDGAGGVPIPDLSSGDSPVVVSGFTSPLLKATVSLFITHTFDADLLLQLISPDGITNVLARNVGGSADNFGAGCADGSRTVFDDAASVSIAVGAAPFIGSFKPAQPFSVFIGRTGTNINGTWHLRVVDQAGIDFGMIQCWSLSLTPSVCTDGGGECPGSDLAIAGSAAPEPVIVNNNLVYTISIINRGPKTAKGVTLTQLLPASVVFVSANISQGSITPSGGAVNGDIGTMAAGAVVTATVTVRPAQAGTLTSTASVVAVSDPDPDPSNNSVTITSHINPPTSDMAVSLAGNPNPVLVGGTLTYTVSVTNNGPSDATGVVASNALPASAALTSATPSQGTTTILGNAVLFNFGSIGVGGVATATITVIPSVQGLITATATVTANQFDSQSANNTASVTTSVSPSADLAVGFQSVPASIVLGNNLTYTINATNLGPSTATSVLISQILPPGATVVSSNTTAGTLSQSGNTINCDVGSLPLGGTVTLTVVVSISSTGTVSSTATITGALADPNAANNSATTDTLVATPFVNIQAAGATLTAESFVPANGAIDPGETVTVQLYLLNAGNVFTTNLMVKLLATNGVTSPSAATQTYGPLAPGGFPDSKLFSFTASGTNGGVITATLQLSGDVSNTVSFTFALPKVSAFADTNVIVIPDIGSGSPYPSTFNVSGITGLVGKVTATLSNFNHTFPHDVSVLLVAPSGTSTLLISHAADLSSAAGADLTFDDSAASPLPASGSVASGSWQPSAYAPAPVFFTNAPPATNPPAGPYGPPAMSLFNGSNPNGTWLLFVMDDSSGDSGGISNGWSLAITTIAPVNQVAEISLAGVGSPNPVQAGSNLTNTFTVTNNGTNSASAVAFTNVLPANVNLISASASQGSVNTNGGKVVANLGSLGVGASATVVEVMTPNASGTLTNTASVSAAEIDLVPANNTKAIITTVDLPVADVAVTVSAAPNPVVTGSNLVYTISVTNNGTNTALNTIVTDPLPSTATFVSSSLGTFSSGTLTCNLGNLVVGTAVSITVTTRPVSIGTITNTVSVATGSSDSNPANNSASVSTIIRAPAANIIAASAKLLSESFTPPDGTVDPGETVSVSLGLSDIGEIDTTSLVATLLNTGGVTGSSGAQNYGAVINNGPAVSRTFSFTASSAASGVVIATLQLQDGAGSLGTVAFNFTLPQTNSFANTNAIIIPNHGSAAPYPSTLNVSGLAGVVSKITVTLNGVTHSFPRDIGVLLVSPSGAKSVVMSGVGGGSSISNLNLTFDDAAAAVLSDSAQIIPGTYKPTDNPPAKNFPTPAPAGVATNLFAKFNGTVPNGVWSLYVVDSAVGDSGVITGGWSLALTTVSPINSAADLSISAAGGPSPVYLGDNVTYTLVVTNKGPSVATAVVISNTLPASAALGTLTHSQGTHLTGGNMVVFNLGSLGVSASATVSIVVNPGVAGLALDTASVSANEADLYLADNFASASVSVLTLISPHLFGAIVKTNQFQITLTGQPNFTYVMQASSNLTAWSSISTNTAAGNGVLQFTDTNAPGLNQRFYRAVVVAP